MPILHDLATVHSLGKRDCYYNRYGRYVCNNWSTGARIGVGVAIAVGVIIFILLISGLGMRRRRRMAASTQPAFNVQQQQPMGANNTGYYNQQQGAYGQPGYQQPYQTGYEQYPQGGYGGYGGGNSYPPPQGYYSREVGDDSNPVGPEQRAFKTGSSDVNGDGQYEPPSGPPPGSSPAVPPPAYGESGKRV